MEGLGYPRAVPASCPGDQQPDKARPSLKAALLEGSL